MSNNTVVSIRQIRINSPWIKIAWEYNSGESAFAEVSYLGAFQMLDYLQQFSDKFGIGDQPINEGEFWPVELPAADTTQIIHVAGLSVAGNICVLQWLDHLENHNLTSLTIAAAQNLLVFLEKTLLEPMLSDDVFELTFPKPIALNKFSTIWRTLYRKNRYLKKASDDELANRTREIMNNVMVLGDDRIYRPQIVTDERKYYRADRNLDWLRLLTEVHMEMEFRPREIKLIPDGQQIYLAKRLAEENWAWRPDLINVTSNLKYDYAKPKIAFKYAKKQWNEKILNEGAIRLTPASSYGNQKYVDAIQGDELSLDYFDADGAKFGAIIPDYYVFCLACCYDYRLFHDFEEADSCLVINDVDQFIERMVSKAKSTFSNKIAQMYASPMIYFDPYKTEKPSTPEEICFGKPFGYAYQHEFRIAGIPKDGTTPLSVLELQIGDISDIAELVSRQ